MKGDAERVFSKKLCIAELDTFFGSPRPRKKRFSIRPPEEKSKVYL
jgi:hypothetical protein